MPIITTNNAITYTTTSTTTTTTTTTTNNNNNNNNNSSSSSSNNRQNLGRFVSLRYDPSAQLPAVQSHSFQVVYISVKTVIILFQVDIYLKK